MSDRKTRLLLCACVRRGVWQRLRDPRCRAVVEVAERFADERASADELQDASAAAAQAAFEATTAGLTGGPARNVCCAAWATAWSLAAAPEAITRYLISLSFSELFAQRLGDLLDRVLTDVAGPETLPVLEPAWLAWDGGTLRRLARAIYEDRDFADLPVLADALEDSGCTDPALLGHLRGPGLHARGCWALDLLLEMM